MVAVLVIYIFGVLEEVKNRELKEGISLALACQGRVDEERRHQKRASLHNGPNPRRKESGSKASPQSTRTAEILEITAFEHELPFAHSAQILCTLFDRSCAQGARRPTPNKEQTPARAFRHLPRLNALLIAVFCALA